MAIAFRRARLLSAEAPHPCGLLAWACAQEISRRNARWWRGKSTQRHVASEVASVDAPAPPFISWRADERSLASARESHISRGQIMSGIEAAMKVSRRANVQGAAKRRRVEGDVIDVGSSPRDIGFQTLRRAFTMPRWCVVIHRGEATRETV